MSLPLPTFDDLVREYPRDDVGQRYGVVHTCAIRMSEALSAVVPGFRRAAFYSASRLVDYMINEAGWNPLILRDRDEAENNLTGQQGIIFWKTYGEQYQVTHFGDFSPNHIDLWDPTYRSLNLYVARTQGRSMLWIPQARRIITNGVRFWSLTRN